MDEVFGKYCKKYPEIYKCVEEVTEKVKPCLSAEEQKTLSKTLTIVGELKEFICFKDGDRIASKNRLLFSELLLIRVW